jgi:hypothetical protein
VGGACAPTSAVRYTQFHAVTRAFHTRFTPTAQPALEKFFVAIACTVAWPPDGPMKDMSAPQLGRFFVLM